MSAGGLPTLPASLHRVARHRSFDDKTIGVTRRARICLGNSKINFGQVFAGQAVGIKEVLDDIWLVMIWGYFDLETRVLEPLENPFGPKV